jgi:hypothetical protein
MPPKIDNEVFEWLGEQLEPPPPPPPVKNKKWMPRQTPAQRKLWNAKQKSVLCWGPKGGSKSFGAGDKMAKHCYDNRNALVLILVRVQNMAVKGGVWDKLITEVLPRWKDGNRDREGRLLDEGLGLHYSEVKFDANHCPFIWIQNKFGGWSMITVMSCPHANQLRQRIRGVEPSMVFVDELTSCDSVEYFESVAAQLGRRPQVTDPQQFIGACNPEDPDHWVFKKWFEEPFDDETGEKDPNFHDIFFPAEENRENLQPGYLEGLASVYGKNATEAARMIGGEWVSAPSGESIFQEVFSVMSHVRPLDEQGRPSKTEWLMPHKGHPMIIGIDSGIVHHAFIFMQRLPVDGKMKWLIFDEVVLLRRKLTYATIMPIVMRRIRWWFDTVGEDLPMVWISDDSAMKFFRPGAGTYDSLDMEREYAAYRSKVHLPPIKIKAAPKFSGSVEASIRIEQTAMAEDALVVSARCTKVIAMYNRLECEKQKQGQPFDPKLASTPRRSDHLHVFAAGAYPKLTASIQPSLLIPRKEGTQTLISVRAA